MFLDLTQQKILENAIIATGLNSEEYFGNDSRGFILCARDLNLSPEEQTRQLLFQNDLKEINAQELALLKDQRDWSHFHCLTKQELRVFAANAFIFGLAYGPLSVTQIKDSKYTPSLLPFIDYLLDLFANPECKINGQSNQGNWGWNPISEHTFDACLLIADAKLLGIFVIVEED